MNRQRPRSMQELEQLWYNRPNGQSDHYDCTRYHALNLHSVVADGEAELDICLDFFRVEGGVEQPEFNGALGEHTLEQKRAKPTRTHNSNEKYTFRTWLLRLEMIGDEFKTAAAPAEASGGEYRLAGPGIGTGAEETAGSAAAGREGARAGMGTGGNRPL